MFAAVWGITRDSANELAALVRQAAMEGDITKEGLTVFGRYYTRGKMEVGEQFTDSLPVGFEEIRVGLEQGKLESRALFFT